MTSAGAETQCNNNDGSLLELSSEAVQLPELRELLSKYGAGNAWLGGKKQKSWYWSKDGVIDSKIINFHVIIDRYLYY